MLWLALRFANLPLDVYSRACGPAQSAGRPIGVSNGSGASLLACNEAARALGIRPGMPVSAATALAGGLHVLPRDSTAEGAALERIAAWAMQFTPAVSIAPPAEVLLEIGGSLKVFGGLNPLWSAVAGGLKKLGYAVFLACAPTPLAAQWFTRAELAVRLQHADMLRSSLADLPLHVMGLDAETLGLLQNIGAVRVSDCLALPRGGLARRIGQRFIDDLDRALGALPDPRPFFTPPGAFKAVQPLPAPALEAEMLLFAANRLLDELCGFLAAKASGVQQLRFTFSHHGSHPTQISLALVTATRDPVHLTHVLRERLARTALPEPATAIELESELLLPLAAQSLSLLPNPGQQEEAAVKLIERLRARLGDEAVVGLERCPDYRPEFGWRTCTPGNPDAACRAVASRPLWLLARPHPLSEAAGGPCYDGRLTLLAGPERIESGWWDGADVARDYFVAANPAESMLWIYRERSTTGGWFLHGFFA